MDRIDIDIEACPGWQRPQPEGLSRIETPHIASGALYAGDAVTRDPVPTAEADVIYLTHDSAATVNMRTKSGKTRRRICTGDRAARFGTTPGQHGGYGLSERRVERPSEQL